MHSHEVLLPATHLLHPLDGDCFSTKRRSCSNKLYECSSSTSAVKLDTLNRLRFKLNCIFTPGFMYWCRGTGLHELVRCLSRATRLHQALGLQQTATGEMILYLHTRQDKQHPNAASGITNSIPMYRTEISLFCGLFCCFSPQTLHQLPLSFSV